LIDTVIAACNAASAGDVKELRRLKAKGVDLNHGDYDNRTPLHVACGAGHFDVVEYLVVEAGVIVSPVDRWGATPLNDADPYPKIKALLLANGGFKGKI
jgi:ankyrin repeat protein